MDTCCDASLAMHPDKQCHISSTVCHMNQRRAGDGSGGLLSAPCRHIKCPLINFIFITEWRKTRPLLIDVALIYASENYLQWKKNEYCQIWLIHVQFTLLCLYLKRFKVVTNLNDMQNGIGLQAAVFSGIYPLICITNRVLRLRLMSFEYYF